MLGFGRKKKDQAEQEPAVDEQKDAARKDDAWKDPAASQAEVSDAAMAAKSANSPSSTRDCRRLAIIIISGRAQVQDRVTGLELGADDYVIKPFDPAEVVARIRARPRKPAREAPRGGHIARFAGWSADFDRYLLTGPDGAETPLSHAEAEMLRMFLDSPRRLISRAQMLESLGGSAGDSFDRAMDVRISRLRTKLGEDPKNPRLIKTIYGAGYIFLSEVAWS